MKFRKLELQENSGKFLRIKSGESIKGVFRGEIYEFMIKWENNKSHVVENLDLTKNNRFKLNFVVFEEGRFIAKIWEFSQTVYNTLSSIAEEYPLEKTKVKITRQGVGTETTYHILPLLNEPLGPQALSQIEAVELAFLGTQKKPEPENRLLPASNYETEEDLPF